MWDEWNEKCLPCPKGASCRDDTDDGGAFLRNLQLEPGYYRHDIETDVVFNSQKHGGMTTGGDVSGADSCAKGYHLHLCATYV